MSKKRGETNRDEFDGISSEVGARLAERRSELGMTLRTVAETAAVSIGHLSDIENGRSQVSLPILLRLVQALDLTVTDLLPRIGGHHVASGSLDAAPSPGSLRISHPELELNVSLIRSEAGTRQTISNPTRGDLLVHVLSGRVELLADDTTILLEAGDTLDSERLTECQLRFDTDCKLLVVTGGES